MDRRTIFLAVVALITFSVAFSITMLATARTDLSPTKDLPLEVCNSLDYNSPSAFNVLFISSRSEAEAYKQDLLSEPPYDARGDRFNFYYIDSLDPNDFCKSYKDIAVLCYSSDLLKKSSACPHDAIIVLVDRDSGVRSSMYKNVLSLNTNHPSREVLRHELGHLFGLAEEYVPASLPSGQQNCKETCDSFSSETDGCFEGCSKSTLFRSIEGGVMRTLETSEYGVYDEHLIRQRLDELTASSETLTGRSIAEDLSCSDRRYRLVEVDATQELWHIVSQELVSGCSSGTISFDYIAEQTDSSGFKQSETTFPGNVLFTDAPGEGQINGESYEETRFWIELPETLSESTLTIKDQEGNEHLSTLITRGDASPCRIS